MKIFVTLFVLFFTVRGQIEKSSKPGNFPRSVQIFNDLRTEDSKSVCDGAVIDKNWVFTAASGVQSKQVYVVAVNEKAGVPRIRCRSIHALNLFKSGFFKLFYDIFMTCFLCRRQNNC